MAEEPIPKLRMAPTESPEELARRFERERRAIDLQRETQLGEPTNFRIGSVPYLNAAPLVRGLEDEIELLPPSKLAEKLRAGQLDAALLSITEPLFHDAYDILDGIAIASLGEVQSVLVAHRGPLDQITKVHCDTASLTSVNLLRVLFAERGIKAEFVPLASYQEAPSLDNVLLIGDPAIEFLLANHPHEIWDLGAAWFELTKLPFVYAVWALRRSINNTALKRQLREARDFGLDTLDHIINTRPEFTLSFRKDYLGWHIHYHLGSDEKRGLAKFVDLLRKHHPGPVYDPRFVV